jgi:hypothetical protein
MPYPHLDSVHLNFDGYMALGNRIGECQANIHRTDKIAWQGPRLMGAKFADPSRRRIRVNFDSETPLKLLDAPLGAGTYGKGHKPEMDWFVTDDQHQGYAELLAAKIENGQVLLEVAGASIDATATRVGEKAICGPPQDLLLLLHPRQAQHLHRLSARRGRMARALRCGQGVQRLSPLGGRPGPIAHRAEGLTAVATSGGGRQGRRDASPLVDSFDLDWPKRP